MSQVQAGGLLRSIRLITETASLYRQAGCTRQKSLLCWCRVMYDRSTDFWQMLFHICSGLTIQNRHFWSQFFSSQMRFYRQMLMASKARKPAVALRSAFILQTVLCGLVFIHLLITSIIVLLLLICTCPYLCGVFTQSMSRSRHLIVYAELLDHNSQESQDQ